MTQRLQMVRLPLAAAMLASLGVLSGCATIPSRGGFGDVQKMVEPRTGVLIRWNQGTLDDVVAAEVVRAMLREKLTANAAVQIALLNNHSLQATFEELGIAQADLVQAGLLKNPVFAVSARFPDRGPSATNTEFSVAQSFLDIFLIPLRKRLASAQFEQAKLRVSDAVLGLSADVRVAYYRLQAAAHVRSMGATIVQAARVAAELSNRQHAAGNVNDLELAEREVVFQEAELDLTRSEGEVLERREQLNHLMGFKTGPTWKISEQLPALPKEEPPLEVLEEMAIDQRFDLAAARQQTKILEQALAVTRAGRIPAIEVGVETERETDRTNLTGPTLQLELPIFDQRQADVARLKAQLRQSQRRVSALENQIRSEVRTARDRMLTARRLIERYRDVAIPLHEKIVAESQKHYNFMLIGVFHLLEAKRDEVDAYREYIEAFGDYWNARSRLERAVGGRLAVAETVPLLDQPKRSQPTPRHHEHGGQS